MKDVRWLGLCFGLLAASCGDGSGKTDDDDEDGEVEEGPVGEATGATCPKGSKLDYKSFAEPFFATYCTSCHAASVKGDDRMNAPDDHNFDTLAGIVDEIEHVDGSAGGGPKAINRTMPPAGSKAPSDQERKLLSEWIACGAP